jgi:hypothetical protein
MLELYPAPSHAWTNRFVELTSTDYLAKKYNRSRRLREKLDYINEHCGEIRQMRQGVVVDIGPGPGEFLEWCRSFGHMAYGVDAVIGDGGMGWEYLELSRLMTYRQELQVDYTGFREWLKRMTAGAGSLVDSKVILINSQGSLEQCFAEYLIGPPHHEHHDCHKQLWDHERFPELWEEFDRMFAVFHRLLHEDGHVLIYCNGTGESAEGTKNTASCMAMLRESAERAGFVVVKQAWRLLKFAKAVKTKNILSTKTKSKGNGAAQ